MALAAERFYLTPPEVAEPDARIAAMANAIRGSNIVCLDVASAAPRTIHPVRLEIGTTTCGVVGQQDASKPIPLKAWGSINVSAKIFQSKSAKPA